MTTTHEPGPTIRHLHAVPDDEDSLGGYDLRRPRYAAHEFLRKPRTHDFPYETCHPVLVGALRHQAARGADLWRWTPDDVEDLLGRWFPEPSLHSPELLKYLPDLIGDFVRFAHCDTVPAEQTRAVIDTVDRLRPEFLCVVGADGWQTPPYRWSEPVEPPHPLQDLADRVGGLEALEQLDAEPLPDEPFAWTEVPGDLVPLFEDLVPLLDAFADDRLDVEFRTAIRRFVALLACRDPRPLRRKGTVVQRAAAVAWATLRANDEVGPGRRQMTAKEVSAWFGVGSAADRGRSMLQAATVATWHDWGSARQTGDATILIGRRRQEIVSERDRRATPTSAFLDRFKERGMVASCPPPPTSSS